MRDRLLNLLTALLPCLAGCHRGPRPQLLAVGGTHVFDHPAPCQLDSSDPPGAVRDLGWEGQLALEASGAAEAAVTCGDERVALQFVVPATLRLALVDPTPPLTPSQHLRVQVALLDDRGQTLQIGKFTHITWTASGSIAADNDRSAGEFGLCDTCYGAAGFRTLAEGEGTIRAQFQALEDSLTLRIAAGP